MIFACEKCGSKSSDHDDGRCRISELTAERDALRAENKDLWVKANQSLQECQAECDRANEENDALKELYAKTLRKEDRLVKALEKIAMGCLSYKYDVRAACKAALGEKPE